MIAGARNSAYEAYKREAAAEIRAADMMDDELRAKAVAHLEALEAMRTDDHEGQVRRLNLVALVVAEHLGLSFGELMARGEQIEERLDQEERQANMPDLDIPF